MIKAIIVDDEYSAIESLKWELNNFCSEVSVIESFTNPLEAISAINYLKPDLVFLDIEMPELDGFQLLKKLEFKDFNLIITTAYNQYAIKAFRENAIDYLLKPVDPDELVKAVEKVSLKKMSNQGDIEAVFKKYLTKDNLFSSTRIPLALSDKVIMVERNDVMYCVSDGNYTNVKLKDGQNYLLSKTLKLVAEKLPSPQFVRVHKKYLVNINFVSEYVRGDGGELLMSDQLNIPVSRSHKEELLQSLQIV